MLVLLLVQLLLHQLLLLHSMLEMQCGALRCRDSAVVLVLLLVHQLAVP